MDIRIAYFNEICRRFDVYVDLSCMLGMTMLEDEQLYKDEYRATKAEEHIAVLRIQRWWRIVREKE